MELNGNTFFIYNKKYEHAKLAQWGTEGRDVGTYEQNMNADQLWILEESPSKTGYYYIKNAKHEKYRLAKWGIDDGKAGVYSGQYHDDQLWRFQKEGDYYRIYNKEYPSAKIAKWGKGDGDWGTYAGGDNDDQLWKLVPRFEAKAWERDVFNPIDNRNGTNDIPIEVKVTTGLKLTRSSSLTTRVGLEYSLKSSLSAGIDGITAGMESTATFSSQIEASIASAEERFWSKEVTKKYTAPAGKKYRVVQTVLDFSSLLDFDNCSLYCQERVEESY